jgi:phosphatidylserine decarboxylase
MKLHKEGHKIIFNSFLINLILVLIFAYLPVIAWVKIGFMLLPVLGFSWTVFFFRVPQRKVNTGDHILSAADGTIVAIEETFVEEYFNAKRLQISVFMSGFDVHVNWYPFEGIIKYTQYHEGHYFMARHPKSSEENERSSIVLEKEKGKDVLIRQVAGIMARRIVYYAKPGDPVKQGEELGMIRFGSRVDFYLPLGTKVDVKLGQKVRAQKTVLAHFA